MRHDTLKEILKNHSVILASASPRRRQILGMSGIDFTVAPKFECEEKYPGTLPCSEVPVFLSRLKSEAYPERLRKGQILVTADTVVILGNEILGKPKDREDALRMLRSLSGCTHRVVTGVTLRSENKIQSFSAVSTVKFRRMTDREILFYIDNFRPYDKAGAYGIQEWIGYVAIERIHGSFYNIMGLPMQMLGRRLREFISAR